MEIRANCKINIGLDVLRRRDDGFHDLSTVMLPVRELYDVLHIEKAEHTTFSQEGIIVDCPLEKNLCIKALRMMQAKYGIGQAAIHLDKRVPFGAGLGGGSSDATAVILALNKLYALNLSEEQLITAAAEIGSDTAFFIRNTPQLCSGRGEIMEDISLPLKGLWLVIVKPEEGISTAEAYSGVKPAIPQVTLAQKLMQPVAQWQGSVKNDFEPHIFAAHPQIAALKQILIEQGAIYASMSGSGSALFGIFKDPPTFKLEDNIFIHTEQL